MIVCILCLCFVFCVLCSVFCVLCFVFCVLCFMFCVLCFVRNTKIDMVCQMTDWAKNVFSVITK